jgi:hypothetical protein
MIPKDNNILILDKVSLVIPIIVRLDSEIPDSETLKITDRNRLDNTLILKWSGNPFNRCVRSCKCNSDL